MSALGAVLRVIRIQRPQRVTLELDGDGHENPRIRAIDTAAAKAHPGVHTVLTSEDLPAGLRDATVPFQVPNPAISQPLQQRLLEDREVHFVGEPIGLVLAESRYVAEDAAALVDIDYEVLGAAASSAT